jgi:hypothetical protein
MVEKVRYRPAAPSDGLGNIAVPDRELNLEEECADYAEYWNGQENKRSFLIGCCNHVTRPATIFALEAARCMCAGSRGNERALKLLQMAVDDLKVVIDNQKSRAAAS